MSGVIVSEQEWEEWERERLDRSRDVSSSPPERLASARSKRSRSLLPSLPPGTEAAMVRQWLGVVLGQGSDRIADVQRYGRHDDAPLVIALRSGRRIRWTRQADIFNADALVRRVVLSTGAEIPAYGKADAHVIASALVRVAETVEQDDERAEALEWARAFLEVAHEIGRYDMSTPSGRFDGLLALRDWRLPDAPPYLSVAERSAVLRDTHGRRFVKASSFAAHVRAHAGKPVSWAALNGRMAEVGWLPSAEYEQRRPRFDGKAKLHAFVVPPDWDDDA